MLIMEILSYLILKIFPFILQSLLFFTITKLNGNHNTTIDGGSEMPIIFGNPYPMGIKCLIINPTKIAPQT